MNEKLWNKNFILLSFINFNLTLVFFLLNVIMIEYTSSTYHVSSFMGGIVSGIFVVGTCIGRLISVRLMNKYQKNFVCFAGLLSFSALILLYFMSLSFNVFILVRFIHGLFLGIASTVVQTLVSISIPKNKKGEGISYFSISTALATGLGPFIGIALTQAISYKTIFLLCFIVSILSMFISCMIQDKKVEDSNDKQSHKYLALEVIPIASIMLLLAISFSSVMSYLNSYAIEMHLVESASYYFIIYSIVVLITRPYTGKHIDKGNEVYIMFITMIFFAIGIFILSVLPSHLGIILSAIFVALGFGNAQSCIQALCIKKVKHEQIGQATATFSIFFELGTGIGPSILGIILAMFHLSLMYFITSILIVLTILIYAYIRNK